MSEYPPVAMPVCVSARWSPFLANIIVGARIDPDVGWDWKLSNWVKNDFKQLTKDAGTFIVQFLLLSLLDGLTTRWKGAPS